MQTAAGALGGAEGYAYRMGVMVFLSIEVNFPKNTDYHIVRNNSTDINIVTGAMFFSILSIGITNCSTVQLVVATERSVFNREKATGMYSALPYAVTLVIMEIPYIYIPGSVFSVIAYAMLGFEWRAIKFFNSCLYPLLVAFKVCFIL